MIQSVKLTREAVSPLEIELEDIAKGNCFVLGGNVFIRPIGPTINRQVGTVCLNDGSKSFMPPSIKVRPVMLTIHYSEIEERQ
jgi:hypothetical protein